MRCLNLRRWPGPPLAARRQIRQYPSRKWSALRELKDLSQAQAEAKTGAGPEIERLKVQLELQQKQIDVLLRMTNLLAEQVKKKASAGADLEKLEEQVVTQGAQIQQGAQRDIEQAQAHDQVVEQIDALSRSDSWLPANLKELFSPFRNNESPLAIYGSVAEEFNAFSKLNSTFRDQTIELRPYLLLNEKWLMSGNVALQQGTVQLWRGRPNGSSTTISRWCLAGSIRRSGFSANGCASAG